MTIVEVDWLYIFIYLFVTKFLLTLWCEWLFICSFIYCKQPIVPLELDSDEEFVKPVPTVSISLHNTRAIILSTSNETPCIFQISIIRNIVY